VSIDWSETASAEARAMLRNHAEDLYEEAERITLRADADTVAPSYVRQAAVAVKMRRSTSAIGDVFLAIGPALAGIGAGVGITVLTAGSGAQLPAAVSASAIGVACVGMLFTGAGSALKLRK
jgi:hypothetical protein